MQSFEGVVISSKTKDTVRVEIVYFQKHPKYQKVLEKTTKLVAHNEIDGIKEGDKVEITNTKPYSKTKHFKVTKKLENKG